MNINESNVTIMVQNMDNAINFYKSIGLTLKNRWENHYAMMTATGIALGIHPAEGKSRGSGSVSIGFMIESIDEARTLLEENKIAYSLDAGKSGSYLHFKDPDDTLLYFVQPAW